MNLSKLFFSFAVIFVVATASAVFTIIKMQELSTTTQKMYTHPFMVTNAVSDIQTSIIRMHRNMKDIVLTKNSAELIRIIEDVQREEEKVFKNFDVIYENYLGAQNEIDHSYVAFKSWKSIRKEVIYLVNEKKIEEAIDITKGKEAEHVKNLHEQIDFLKHFSYEKAQEFYDDAMKNSRVEEVAGVFIATFLVTLLIVTYIINSLLSINRSNKKQLYMIDQNILTARLNVNQEVIEVSSALCRELQMEKEKVLGTRSEHFFIDKEQYESFKVKIFSGKEHAAEVKVLVDGTIIWFDLEVFPELDDNYELSSFSLFMTNISDKKRIEEVSITDTLTRLHNRNYFEIIFEKEIRRAKRDKKLLGIVMIDIDYFKQYNDTYGHQEGDKALKAVSNILASHTSRSYDNSFRVGGEEFILLCYQENFAVMEGFVQELIAKVEGLQIEHKNSEASQYLTISAGVLQCGNEHHYHSDEIYKAVDRLLYEAKTAGRNQFKSMFID